MPDEARLLQRTDPAVMTMVNVTLCLVLVVWFLTRDDEPARSSRRRRRSGQRWRRAHRRWHAVPRRPGAAGRP